MNPQFNYKLEIINETPQSCDPEDCEFFFGDLTKLMDKLKELILLQDSNLDYARDHWPEENIDRYEIKFNITTIYQ